MPTGGGLASVKQGVGGLTQARVHQRGKTWARACAAAPGCLHLPRRARPPGGAAVPSTMGPMEGWSGTWMTPSSITRA
jgi:hypothetical protein